MRVSFEEIDALANEVNRGADELNQIVGRLTAAFGNSSSYWEGNAQREFNSAFEQWKASWMKMNESLQDMQRLIREWNAKARELDQSVRRG
jgi:WXG100 family type VII secretion target